MPKARNKAADVSYDLSRYRPPLQFTMQVCAVSRVTFFFFMFCQKKMSEQGWVSEGLGAVWEHIPRESGHERLYDNVLRSVPVRSGQPPTSTYVCVPSCARAHLCACVRAFN